MSIQIQEDMPTDEEIMNLSGGLLDKYYPPLPPAPEEVERSAFVTGMASVFRAVGEPYSGPVHHSELDTQSHPFDSYASGLGWWGDW